MKKNRINNFEGYKIYTDGSCDNVRTHIGGYSYLVIDNKGEEVSRFAASESKTTNNRMELKAIVEAVKTLPSKSIVSIFTDSMYCITVLNHTTKMYDKNMDLIGEFREVIKRLDLTYRFAWVKGHSGHEQNEIVDKLANEAVANNGGRDIDYKRFKADEEYKYRELFKAKIYSLVEDLFLDFVPYQNQEAIMQQLSIEIDNRFTTINKKYIDDNKQ